MDGPTSTTSTSRDPINTSVEDDVWKSKTECSDVAWYRSARSCTAVMSALGYMFFYLLRVNMSLALVFMVADQTSFNASPSSPPPSSSPLSPPSPPSSSSLSSSGHRWARQTTETSDSKNQTGDFAHLSLSPGASTSDLNSNNPGSTAKSSFIKRIRSTATTPRHFVTTKEVDECAGSSIGDGFVQKQGQGEFTWSKEMTGYILSSFFYGYIVTQLPGGWMATRFGAKHVFGGGMFISILVTFLTPLAARTHPYILIALRTVMGLAHGAGFPSTHVLYSLWFPPMERTRYITFSHAGTMVGAIVAFSVSGFICDIRFDNGWPLIFYIYGSASLLWFILWNYFVYNSPLEHPRIHPIERDYIISKIGPSVYGGVVRSDKIPWSKVIRSKPVWAIVVSHVGNNWANYTILVCIPLFMKEVLKFGIKENGVLSSLPYLLSYFVAIGSGQVADLLIRKKILSTTATRKILQLLASGIPAALLVGMGYLNCQSRYWAVLLLCLIVGTNSFSKAGFLVNHVDIAPRYAGLLLGISNTLATAPGILSPIVVGQITTEGTREEWMVVFITCAFLLMASCIFYLIFGDGTLQKWATPSLTGIISPNDESKPINGGTNDSLVTKM